MPSLSHPSKPTSGALLMRILEQPELVSAVRELPPPVLSKLIDRIGLEDSGELVALATAEQLERMFDDDLWKSVRAGEDETFRSDRFALWLEVMMEAGEEHFIRRLLELPRDMLALAVHRLVLVIDMDALADVMSTPTYDAMELDRALENTPYEEWEEFRMFARDASAWDVVGTALLALDRDHHDYLRAILEQCCAMSTEFINGNGSLFEVLTSEELLESDAAAEREDRRAAAGFVSPADARSFLELARRGEALDERDPITHAYFRDVARPAVERPGAPEHAGAAAGSQLAAASPGLERLVALLAEAEVMRPVAEQPLAVLASGSRPAKGGKKAAKSKDARTAPLFEAAMSALRERDPAVFSQRIEELGYLMNVVLAGSSDKKGRALRPMDALEQVLRACEAGLRAHFDTRAIASGDALSHVVRTPADQLFRRGFRAPESTRSKKSPSRSS
jgi:hypothetical protein